MNRNELAFRRQTVENSAPETNVHTGTGLRFSPELAKLMTALALEENEKRERKRQRELERIRELQRFD